MNSQDGTSYNFGDFYDDEGNLWGGTQCVEFVRAYVNWLVNGNAWTDAWNGPTYDGSNIWENPIWSRLGWTVYTNTPDFLPQPGDIFSSGLYHYGGSACHTGVVISSDVYNGVIADANARNSNPYDGDSVWVHSITWKLSGSDSAYGATHYIRPNFASSVTNYHLDVNVNSDGYPFNSGHSAVTFDVYINGSRVKDDVADYVADLAKGTTYNITDIKVSGCSVNNGNNSYSGTMNSDVTVVIPIITSHSWNSGTESPLATYFTTGVKTYTCINCGATREEDVDKLELPNDPVSVNSVTDGNHTYILYAANTSWTDAKSWCEANNGHLVTITSSAEQAVVSELIGNNKESSFWLGAEKTAGAFSWVTGESWSYTNWAEGEPNNDGTGENYLGTAYHSYEWNDTSVSSYLIRGFVFETENNHTTHTWNEGEIIQKATCTTPGTKLFTCTGCGVTKTESYTVGNNSGTWSAWSEDAPPAGAYMTESKQQYSFSDKETISSSSSSMSGWTLYDSAVTSWGSWSNWQNSAVTATATRQVETRYVEPTYKTVWHYSRSIEGKWSGAYSSYSLTYWPTVQYITLDYQLSRKPAYDTDGYLCYGSYKYQDYSNSLWWNERSERVVDQPGYTQYRYRDGTSTYYFYRWTEFSDWTDTVYTASENRQVNTRTVYRYMLDAPITDHTWDSGEIIKLPTCSENGIKKFTCTVCEETKTEPMTKDLSNHVGGTYTLNEASANCGTNGYSGDIYCAGCNNLLSTGTIIKKTDEHTWNDGVATKEPTCINTGIRTFYCSVCGDHYSETIPKLDTHTWNSGVVTKAPTCMATGERTFTCMICDAQTSEIINRVDHKDADGDGLCDYGCGTEINITDPGNGGNDNPGGNANVCKYCGQVHTGVFGGLISFFHNLLYFFRNLFG
ncbi:MAG: hypothetical protein IJS90_10545 [Clostridia bacterium]|nr:hypothetical protein [Clostridia bacterium]